MKDNLKILTIIIVSVIIISSLYVIVSTPNCGKIIETVIDKGKQKNNNETNNGGNNEPGDGEQEFTHTVFIEECTATWCRYCPDIAGILYEIYKSGNYNFYYVSMIEDEKNENSKVKSRLYDDFNINAFPTVYVDGGFEIIVGGGNKKTVLEAAIKRAQLREVPKIKIVTKAEFDNTTNEIITEILIENDENETYKGFLKVYLTEIISRSVNPHKAFDNNPKPYHFGFIDYIIEKQITINSKSNETFIEKKKITDFIVSDLKPEELMIIAVVFNSQPVKQYSNPPNENEFNAYYADATDATILVQGGNLPPTVGIILPEVGKLHLFGKPIFKTFFKRTVLIGKTTVTADAKDDLGIQKVEFYLDGKLKF
ncbi:MAG: hypothetical protein QHH15_08110, partial [Candidatus Thermoplasmatota archaeon]|nr:hypothetical protein [Candidatus Thermoplasmatota archaeon]